MTKTPNEGSNHKTPSGQKKVKVASGSEKKNRKTKFLLEAAGKQNNQRNLYHCFRKSNDLKAKRRSLCFYIKSFKILKAFFLYEQI